MDINKQEKKDENITSSNIFDDFSDNEEVKEEIKKMVYESDKDIYFYLSKLKDLFQYIIILFLIVLFFWYLYIFIQNNDKLSNSTFLDPICFLILWDITNTNDYCSSISSLKQQYNNEIKIEKNEYWEKINSILVDMYNVENFINSKEVVFLKNKKQSKVDIISILWDFDNMLNEFEPTEKDRIRCFNMEINNKNILNVKCDVYAAWFDELIKWFNWEDDEYVWGTSISYASSFINFIKKKSSIFSVNKEPDLLNSSNLVLENNWFTDKTSFDLELKYNSINIIF